MTSFGLCGSRPKVWVVHCIEVFPYIMTTALSGDDAGFANRLTGCFMLLLALAFFGKGLY